MKDILAIDVGTTSLKAGVFGEGLELLAEESIQYEFNLYKGGFADIHPDIWWEAFTHSCRKLSGRTSRVGVISFSVTTPGLTPMGEDGTALAPAILFLDGRSHRQASLIRQKVGEQRFLREACNLPVSGGSSLSSILWLKEHEPGIWDKTYKFGHCNTYFTRRLTGNWAIDPSTVSITGLYNTAKNNLSYLDYVLEAAELPLEKLPQLMHSHEPVGEIKPAMAAALELPEECKVLCGGNDAVLAAFSGGFTETGDINNINGTCEITNVCIDKPIGAADYNIRCHVLPGKWVTFLVLNTGGKALEWFHRVFCAEMEPDTYYGEYIPGVIEDYFKNRDPGHDDGLPEYVPFLQGSRYSLEQLTAAFSKLSLETTREKMLMGLIRGNCSYHGEHLKKLADHVSLGKTVMTSGGGARIRNYMRTQEYWYGDFEFRYQDQSSLLGAAMLGEWYLRDHDT